MAELPQASPVDPLVSPPAPDRERAAAVERLFKEHNRSLVSYLALRLRSVQEAKEVAQEAYVRVLQLDRPGAESFLKNFLYRVATNLAVDRLRHRVHEQRHEQTIDPDLDSSLNAPEHATLAGEQFDMLFASLNELPPKCREALTLFRLEGLSQQAIAARLQVNERTVRDYINQALRYCRMRIDGAGPDDAKEGMEP
jgi:RNA polymerase sigma-70 factor (ECF subfamily)